VAVVKIRRLRRTVVRIRHLHLRTLTTAAIPAIKRVRRKIAEQANREPR
jgi:hypothetical protein